MPDNLKIAVASGKGGTGKTTVSVNLFESVRRQNHQVTLADCDVEEPNDHVFLDGQLKHNEIVTTPIPSINKDKCVYCGDCAKICTFNAILFVKPISHIQVLPDLCKSCGACLWACKYDAITEYPKKLGVINHYEVNGQYLTEGKLEIGSPFAVPVIKKLKKETPESDIVIYDSPPGTSCPVMETIVDVDFVVVVTEPTPFGLSDLKLMVETLKKMKKQAGVVINRSTNNSQTLYGYLEQESLPVLMEIPFDRKLAAQYSNGKLFTDMEGDYENKFYSLFERIREALKKEVNE
ncbi:MAG: ATP-binding protein [Bacteroidales bacterium]|nr:ATP-binding protein [Bacteroidales bacterium]